MSPRTFLFLSLLTVISVIAAGYAVSREPGFTISRGGELIFPELNAHIDDVNKIEVRTDKRTMTMTLSTAGWAMTEAGGYLVQPKIIKGAILGFSDLTYVEAKTRQSDKYKLLELQNPETPGSKGRGVRLYGKNGDVLVDAVLGRVRYNMPGTTRDGVYIRKLTDPQTWLALGQLDIAKDPSGWLIQKIVNIKSARIKSAEIHHPDGAVVTVSKNEMTDRDFVMAGIPEGKRLKYDSDPENIATVLEDFELDDVKPIADITFDPANTIRSRIITFDGLIIDVNMVERKNVASDRPQYWVTLSASTKAKSAERQAEAKAINAQVSSWVYKIPGYKATRLNKRMEEMLRDREPAS